MLYEKHISLTILAAVLLLFIVSCNKSITDAVPKADIGTAQSWFKNSTEKLAKENMKLILQNGLAINGTLSWQNAEQYNWQGIDYIEVPYIFNDNKQVIDQTDTLQYSLVLRVNGLNGYNGAIAVTQNTRAKILGTDSSTLIQTKTYTLLNGKEGNSWMSSGTQKNKAVQPVIKNETELAAWDAQLKKLKIAGEQGTTKRMAIPEEECRYFVIPTTSISTQTSTSVINDNGDFDESRNITLEEVIVVSKPKKSYEIISICIVKGTGGGNPFPPPSLPGGGGNGGIIQDSIWNDIENKCLKTMVNQAISINLKNQISVFLNKAFGTTDRYNLKFLDREFVDDSTTDAVTYLNSEGLNEKTIFIKFNNNALKNASMEYVAATIFHESIHAWIDYLYPYSLDNKAHHEKLADSFWFNRMQNALMELFPKMSASDAENLTWGGLQYSLRYQLLNLQEKQNVINTNINYKNSYLGTSCDE